MGKRGEFLSYIELPDGSEMDVRVYWDGYDEPAKTWGPAEDCYPAESEMTIVKVHELGQWPEGLSKSEFDELVEQNTERFIEEAWGEYDDA